jgi:hypothetical protein
MISKNDYFTKNEKLAVYVNDELWGLVDSFKEIIEISKKMVVDITLKKPHYQISSEVDEKTTTIVVKAISFGFIKNNYYTWKITTSPVLSYIGEVKSNTPPLEIEIERSSSYSSIPIAPPIPPVPAIPINKYNQTIKNRKLPRY